MTVVSTKKLTGEPDLKWMIGCTIRRVHLYEAASWWFEFSGKGSIRADLFWRLIVRGRVAVSSDDHGHPLGLKAPTDSAERAHALLAAHRIERAMVRGETGDLILKFEHDVTLEILVTSAGYESWAVFFPDGEEVIATGGGELHVVAHAG